MFNVYDCHKLSEGNRMIKLLPVDSLADVLEMAVLAARDRHDAFYRVYEIIDSPTGERFVMAFSILNGRATPWLDVTTPTEHW